MIKCFILPDTGDRMFSITGPGLRCSSEVACAPHTRGLEHSGLSRTSARATAELDKGLIHFHGKELGDRYVRLWSGGGTADLHHIFFWSH